MSGWWLSAAILERGAFALDAAAHILPYYNSYFGTPYPLPKLDLIAGPGTSQFFGAMENWGAIFYFDRDLLIDPERSPPKGDRAGGLSSSSRTRWRTSGSAIWSTMAWWDDLWLNEGFASWMENKVTDQFHPEWHVWLQELGSKQSAMQIDARDGTHPIITPIYDVLQAAGAFDDITYQKGAAVIRTLESPTSAKTPSGRGCGATCTTTPMATPSRTTCGGRNGQGVLPSDHRHRA